MARWYTQQHLWIEKTGSGDLLVGLTQEGLSELSDIAHLEMAALGSCLTEHHPFLVIESTKAAYEINLPFKALVKELYPFDLQNIAKAPLALLSTSIFLEQIEELMDLKAYTEYHSKIGFST